MDSLLNSSFHSVLAIVRYWLRQMVSPTRYRSFYVSVAVCCRLVQSCAVTARTLPTTSGLRQVHVITRHGSRRPLSKSSTTLDDTSETSLLTPLGQKQHYELGQWLRARYINDFSDVLIEYDPNHVLVESTAYERTIVSANSLVLGLFPRESRGIQLFNETSDLIPVYTRARNNDLHLRAYDKCDAYHSSLEMLYASDVWKTMELENMPLLRRLASHPSLAKHVVPNDDQSDPYIPLTELWNVYDAIHVVETECATNALDSGNSTVSQVCQELPDPTLVTTIEEQDRNATKRLAHAVERLRFSPSVAGNQVGGSLLNLILQRMEPTANYTPSASPFLFVTSAHYPTLLGLLTTLETTFTDRDLPDYASALLLELYRPVEDGPLHYVKIFFKPGDSVDVEPVMVSASCRTDLNEGCSLELFVKETRSNRLSTDQWCQVCNNSDVDVCLMYKLQQSLTSTSDKTENRDNYLFAVSFLAGILFAAIVCLLWIIYRSRSSRELKRSEDQRVNPGSDQDGPIGKASDVKNINQHSIEVHMAVHT